MSGLRAAIVHYHLRTGGVTSVIRSAVSALAGRGIFCAVLCGEPPGPGAPECPVRVVEGLGYEDGLAPADGSRLAGDLKDAARSALGGAPDLWHIHNHTLGKTPALPGAVYDLAEAGERLLLQIHDFAEDGRPADYARLLARVGDGDPARLAERLYPRATHVHYAVLNGRDRSFLSAAGAPGSQLHSLPNAVPARNPRDVRENPAERLYLYPTRAIRRKNVGEFLLWAAIAGEGARFAVTRGPRNPEQRPVYERWVAFAQSLALPVAFEAGEQPGASFDELMARASAVVTTSVAEGFGLCFLEPWIAGRPLAGRKLPEVTGLFEDAGLDLSGLYDRLDVPVDWVGPGPLRAALSAGLRRTLEAYGRTASQQVLDRTVSSLTADARVDFGRLDEAMQEAVIRKVRASQDARDELQPNALTSPAQPAARILRNADIVRRDFGLARYGERLASLCETIAASSPGPL